MCWDAELCRYGHGPVSRTYPYYTALVDLIGTLHWQRWVASLGSTSPLLPQKVLELLHELLRVEVFVTQGARRLVTRRVLFLL